MTIKIVTDSCADLPEDLYQAYGIEMIPLEVILNGKSYQDRKEITAQDLMQSMRKGDMPKTSQISVSTFVDYFRKYLEQGNSVIYIGFSSALSGTYQSACMAREEIKNEGYEGQLYVMDSKSATLGQGLTVLQAAKMAKEGRPLPDILKGIAKRAENTEHLFLVEDLNHLYRGGRLSRTSAVVGSIMNVRPLLTLDNGKIEKLEILRGSKKRDKRFKELILNKLATNIEREIGISHGDNEPQALKLKTFLESKGYKNIILNDVGAVIGSHTGPGYIGIFF